MKCKTCGDKLYRGLVFTGAFSKTKIKDAEATFRACVNSKCERFKVIENLCSRCNLWTETKDGISQPCSKCGADL